MGTLKGVGLVLVLAVLASANENCDPSQQYFDLAESRCRNCSDVMRVFEGTPSQDWQPLSGGGNSNKKNGEPIGSAQPGATTVNTNQAPDQVQDFRTRTDFLSSVIGSRLTPLPPQQGTATSNNNNRQASTLGRRPLATSPSGGPLGGGIEPADAILSRLLLGPPQSGSEREFSSSLSATSLAKPTTGADNAADDENNYGAAELDEHEQTGPATSLYANPFANTHQEQQQALLDVESGGEEDTANGGSQQAQEQTNLARLSRVWLKLLWNFLQSQEIYETSLLDSIEQCRSFQNLTGCQMWANMCVMTMYSHSSESSSSSTSTSTSSSSSATFSNIQRQASSGSLRKPPPLSQSPVHSNWKASSNRLGKEVSSSASSSSFGLPTAKISWQQCSKFNLMTICNSFRDWRKQQSPIELGGGGDIFGNEDVDGSLSLRLGSVQSSPLRLGQQIQVVAYEYAFDGRLISVNQFDLADLSKFCLFSSAGSLAPDSRRHYYYNSYNNNNNDEGGYNHQQQAPQQNRENDDNNDDQLFNYEQQQQQQIRVGENMNLRCRFSELQANLLAPKHLNQTKFIDLFIGYQLNGVAFVKPVPILLKNLLYQGQLVNMKHAKDPGRWKFVHRYFPYATIKLAGQQRRQQQTRRKATRTTTTSSSGARRRSGGGDTQGDTDTDDDESNSTNNNNGAAVLGDQDRELLLFVRSANFDIKLRRQQDKGLVISSMLLVLDYDHLPLVRGRRGSSGLNHSGPMTTTTAETTRNDSPNARRGRNSSMGEDGNNNNYNLGANRNSLLTSRLYESHIHVSQSLVDMQTYTKDLDLFVAIVCITSSIWTLIKCYNIQKYQGLIKLDLNSWLLFLVIACDIIANLLGLITLAFALFLFVALKFQPFGLQLQILPPDDGLEQNLLLKLTLAFILKLLGFLYKLAIRLRADLFFIDWERPKMLTSTQIMSRQQRAITTNTCLPEQRTIGNNNNTMNLMQQQQQQQHQISFWRPYTIINRWLQMQTLRRMNLTLQLVAFVSILELGKLDKLATSGPSLGPGGGASWFATNQDNNQQLNSADLLMLEPTLKPDSSPVFRAFILALVYMALALVQLIYKKYFHEPMIKCPIREFVDLCSVGNVSLFSMLYPRFGYYIHGRNANGSGDCGIVEMNVLLEREERDLCSRRGLLPNSDQQTFVLVLPKIINDHYRKLLFRIDHHHQSLNLTNRSSPLNKRQQQQQQPAEFIRSALSLPSPLSSAASQNRSSSFSSMRPLIESVAARNKAINVFLINFLDHAYKDIDYSVRERRRFESLLMEIDLNEEDDDTATGQQQQQTSKFSRSTTGGGASTTSGAGQNYDGSGSQLAATFFVDTDNSFTSLIWLGMECDLIMIELLLLLNLDLWLGPECLILTASLVWMSNKLFQSIYSSLARKNLITKSMLDEKFLIRP